MDSPLNSTATLTREDSPDPKARKIDPLNGTYPR